MLHSYILYFTMEESISSSNVDNKKVIDIAPELCNIPTISINPGIKMDYLDLQDGTDGRAGIKPDNCNPSGYQPQNAIDEVQIKHEVYSDSDIKVDSAYSIIDTYNVYEEERENISQNTEKALKIRHQNDHTQTPIKVEVDNHSDKEMDLDYTMNNSSIACRKNDISVGKDTVNLKDELNQNSSQQLQSKGM